MRTELKVGIVLALVLVLIAAIYLFRRDREQPVEISASPPDQISEQALPQDQVQASTEVPPAGEPLPAPAPLGPSDAVQEQPLVRQIPITGTETSTGGDLEPDSTPFDTDAEDDQPKILVLPPARQPTPLVTPKPTPPQPEPVTSVVPIKPAVEPQDSHYVVRTGDTLFGIAERFYGRGEMWTVIARANPQIGNPKALRVGQKLLIPPADEAVRRYEDIEPPPSQAGGGNLRPYKVKAGESFYSIARDQLNDPGAWEDLFELNKKLVDGNPRRLKAGQTIYLPVK